MSAKGPTSLDLRGRGLWLEFMPSRVSLGLLSWVIEAGERRAEMHAIGRSLWKSRD